MLPVSPTPDLVPADTGQALHALIARLFPICRSITGRGQRETLDILSERLPLKLTRLATGHEVFDWKIPKEWNIRDAWVKGPDGSKVIDFGSSNLHVVSYSTPVRRRMQLAGLREHLYSDPEHPRWIPYRTSYYEETWGFCLSHDQLCRLPDGEYEVNIDSSLEHGELVYGEHLVRGSSEDEIIIFCHTCHPSLCNDNLSGVVITARLAETLATLQPRLSYRFIFAPATIGSIAWLHENRHRVHKIKGGLVASVLGDPGKFHYKKSCHGDAEIDRAVRYILEHSDSPFEVLEFLPWGYDERQFGSPGFRLPVGRLTRSPNGAFAEYHTSADNLDFVQPAALAGSFSAYLRILMLIDNNVCWKSTSPWGEPQLGKRRLYRSMGGFQDIDRLQLCMLWILNQADGVTPVLDVARKSGESFEALVHAAEKLAEAGLLIAPPDH